MLHTIGKNLFRAAKLGFLVVALTVILLTNYRHEDEAGELLPATARESLPDFTTRDLSGREWTLAGQQGHVLLLNFWATWCPPCREETPGLVRIAERYAARGVRIAGVTLDENPDVVVGKFVRDYRISYPVLLPPSHSDLVNGIASLPTTLVIDPQGRLAKVYSGAVDEHVLAAAIDQLLNPSSTTEDASHTP